MAISLNTASTKYTDIYKSSKNGVITDTDSETWNIFQNLKSPKDFTKFALQNGITDFSELAQFNIYETGIPYLIVVNVPGFLKALAGKDAYVKNLLEICTHLMETEFKGTDIFEDMSADGTSTYSNGIQEIDKINKVSQSHKKSFSLSFNEKAGAPFTKLNELYLRGIYDPDTGYKHYNGIIGVEDGIEPTEVGFEQECYSFFYLVVDRTGMQIERAAYIVGAQPTKAEITIHNATKGTVDPKEITMEFNGFVIESTAINAKAVDFLNWINSDNNRFRAVIDGYKYQHAMITDTNEGLAQAGLTGTDSSWTATGTNKTPAVQYKYR